MFTIDLLRVIQTGFRVWLRGREDEVGDVEGCVADVVVGGQLVPVEDGELNLEGGFVSIVGGKKKRKLRFGKKTKKGVSSSSKAGSPDSESSSSSGDSVERVINVKSCPLCHRPRMNSKAEMDIITHLAVCASQDWSAIDKIVVGNFVTASQAQRKWYTKVLGKVSSGDYRLGAVSVDLLLA